MSVVQASSRAIGGESQPGAWGDRTLRVLVPLITVLAAVMLAIGLYLSWRMGRHADLSVATFAFLPGVIAFGVGSYGFRFLRWHILVRRLAPRLPLVSSLRIYMAGFAMGLTPGRLGEFLKFSLLRQESGVVEAESVAIFPLERATEAATFLGLAVLGALSGHFQIQHIAAGAIVTASALPILVLGGLALRSVTRRRQPSSGPRVAGALMTAARGLTTVAGVRALLPALVCAALARCCDAMLFYLAAQAVGLALSLPAAAMVWGLAGLVGGLSMLPAGVGAVEATIVTTVLGLGGDGTAALAAALLSRVATLWLWAPPGLWLAFRASRGPAPKAAYQPVAPTLRVLRGQPYSVLEAGD